MEELSRREPFLSRSQIDRYSSDISEWLGRREALAYISRLGLVKLGSKWFLRHIKGSEWIVHCFLSDRAEQSDIDTILKFLALIAERKPNSPASRIASECEKAWEEWIPPIRRIDVTVKVLGEGEHVKTPAGDSTDKQSVHLSAKGFDVRPTAVESVIVTIAVGLITNLLSSVFFQWTLTQNALQYAVINLVAISLCIIVVFRLRRRMVHVASQFNEHKEAQKVEKKPRTYSPELIEQFGSFVITTYILGIILLAPYLQGNMLLVFLLVAVLPNLVCFLLNYWYETRNE